MDGAPFLRRYNVEVTEATKNLKRNKASREPQVISSALFTEATLTSLPTPLFANHFTTWIAGRLRAIGQCSWLLSINLRDDCFSATFFAMFFPHGRVEGMMLSDFGAPGEDSSASVTLSLCSGSHLRHFARTTAWLKPR